MPGGSGYSTVVWVIRSKVKDAGFGVWCFELCVKGLVVEVRVRWLSGVQGSGFRVQIFRISI